MEVTAAFLEATASGVFTGVLLAVAILVFGFSPLWLLLWAWSKNPDNPRNRR